MAGGQYGRYRNIALGVEAVEFDVHETRDRRFVVIHDPALERTAHGTSAIRELSASDMLTHWMALPVRQITTDRPDLAPLARSRLSPQPGTTR